MTSPATTTTQAADATSVPPSDTPPEPDPPTTVRLSGDLAGRLLASARWQQ